MMHRTPAVANERPFESGVQVFIPAALNRPTHTLYSICMVVQPTAQEWTVNRRYSQFLQLKKDLLGALSQKARCPGCASFHIALSKFPFPSKSLLRTNSVVRRRVTSLQDFLKLLAERIFNDLPKCAICGDEVQRMVRPFLIRGAQPIGPSIPSKIQQSLSLESYAYVPRTIPGPDPDAALLAKSRVLDGASDFADTDASSASSAPVKPSYSSNHGSDDGSNSHTMSSGSDDSYASASRRHDSDAIMELPTSPSASEYGAASDASDDEYAKKYGVERCTDSKVPIEEAIKNVVLPRGVSATYSEVLLRLSSMWDAYEDSAAVLASLPPERLSQRISDAAESVDEVSL